MSDFLTNGNPQHPLFVFAHGAGADCRSDFMSQMAALLAEQGLYVVRFDFPYMRKRQEDGKKRPPERAPVLLADYQRIIRELNRPCVIGGKSMGGRMASLLAQDPDSGCEDDVLGLIKGVACLGYPFHPPGKPDNLRIHHLQTLRKPQLMVQGTRDPMGNLDEVSQYPLDNALKLLWLTDGDHDLKPRKASGGTHQGHMEAAAEAVAAFVKECR